MRENIIKLEVMHFSKGIYSKKIVINKKFDMTNRETKMYLRRIARSVNQDDDNKVCYFTPIELTDDSDNESDIPIDNLGKWLWGLKKYPTHLSIENTEDSIFVYYPENAPNEVEEFLLSLKKAVEKI